MADEMEVVLIEAPVLAHDLDESGRTPPDGACGNRVRLDDLRVNGAFLERFAENLGNLMKIVEGAQFRKAKESRNKIDLCHSKRISFLGFLYGTAYPF